MNKDEITQYYNDQALAGKKKREDEDDGEDEDDNDVGSEAQMTKHSAHNHQKENSML